MEKKLRAAQIQMSVKETKAETVRYLTNKMKEICDGSVDMVCLPEMFCCPYKTELFPEYAEPGSGDAVVGVRRAGGKASGLSFCGNYAGGGFRPGSRRTAERKADL